MEAKKRPVIQLNYRPTNQTTSNARRRMFSCPSRRYNPICPTRASGSRPSFALISVGVDFAFALGRCSSFRGSDCVSPKTIMPPGKTIMSPSKRSSLPVNDHLSHDFSATLQGVNILDAPGGNSPPERGGVDAALRKSGEATLAPQTGGPSGTISRLCSFDCFQHRLLKRTFLKP
jgi:hypothetical protein